MSSWLQISCAPWLWCPGPWLCPGALLWSLTHLGGTLVPSWVPSCGSGSALSCGRNVFYWILLWKYLTETPRVSHSVWLHLHPWCWAVLRRRRGPNTKISQLGRCCSTDGSGESSASSCGCSEAIPRQLKLEKLPGLHSASTAWRYRGPQHCFDWHGGQIRKVPLTGNSKESGQEAWDVGVEAACSRCLPWGEAPRLGLAEEPPMGRGAPSRGAGSLVTSRHRPERIPTISPSRRASVIFLGIKKKKPTPEGCAACVGEGTVLSPRCHRRDSAGEGCDSRQQQQQKKRVGRSCE